MRTSIFLTRNSSLNDAFYLLIQRNILIPPIPISTKTGPELCPKMFSIRTPSLKIDDDGLCETFLEHRLVTRKMSHPLQGTLALLTMQGSVACGIAVPLQPVASYTKRASAEYRSKSLLEKFVHTTQAIFSCVFMCFGSVCQFYDIAVAQLFPMIFYIWHTNKVYRFCISDSESCLEIFNGWYCFQVEKKHGTTLCKKSKAPKFLIGFQKL